jgi:hypothetical protein
VTASLLVEGAKSFAELVAPLSRVIPPMPVDIRGQWSRTSRRTYASETQLGTGQGPFVEVEDARWRGALECAVPLAGIAVLLTEEETRWSRSAPAALAPPLEISLHARAGGGDGRASFAADFHGAHLPSLPVPCGPDLTAACLLEAGPLLTSQAQRLAAVPGAELLVVLLPASAIKTARNRLWHLRDELAAALPADLQRFLTRGRSGVLRPPAGALDSPRPDG